MNSQGKEEQDKFREMLQLSQILSQSEAKIEMFNKGSLNLNVLSVNLINSQGFLNQSQEIVDSQNCSVKAVFNQSQNNIDQNGDIAKEEVNEVNNDFKPQTGIPSDHFDIKASPNQAEECIDDEFKKWKESQEYSNILNKFKSDFDKNKIGLNAVNLQAKGDGDKINNFLLNYYIENEMEKFFKQKQKESADNKPLSEAHEEDSSLLEQAINQIESHNDSTNARSFNSSATKQQKSKAVLCEHQNRKHYAKGLCSLCYSFLQKFY